MLTGVTRFTRNSASHPPGRGAGHPSLYSHVLFPHPLIRAITARRLKTSSEQASRQKTSRGDEGDDSGGGATVATRVSHLPRSHTKYIKVGIVSFVARFVRETEYVRALHTATQRQKSSNALHLGVALKNSCAWQVIFRHLTLLLTLLFPPRGLAAAAKASHGSDRGAGVRSSSVMGRMNTCKEGHEFMSTKTRKQHGTIQRSCSKFGSCYSYEKFHSRKNGGRLNELDFNTEMVVSCPPNTHNLSVREVVVRQAWV